MTESPAGASKQKSAAKASKAKNTDEVTADDNVWDLFAHQIKMMDEDQSSVSMSQAIQKEVVENLNEHLKDLAIAQAVQNSFDTAVYEAVRLH